MDTVWVLGDHLNRRIGALEHHRPGDVRVLLVEVSDGLGGRRYHRQRLHLVLAAMRRFAIELRAEGFDVDHRRSPTLLEGLAGHREEHRPDAVRTTEPQSFGLRRVLERAGVEMVRSNQFLCHQDDFATWARTKKQLKMEDFYRWQRQRLGYLMDGDEPAGGQWNFDHDNREKPPRDGRDWPEAELWPLDDLDREVLADLPASAFGADPVGLWATTRDQALERLVHFVDHVLPGFGSHEDAMLRELQPGTGANSYRLNHSLLSHAMNIGLLHPGEVVEAAEDAYRSGRAPIASVEGFVRQIIGWREYVWGSTGSGCPSTAT